MEHPLPQQAPGSGGESDFVGSESFAFDEELDCSVADLIGVASFAFNVSKEELDFVGSGADSIGVASFAFNEELDCSVGNSVGDESFTSNVSGREFDSTNVAGLTGLFLEDLEGRLLLLTILKAGGGVTFEQK